jgi:hypothetical protein
MNGRADPAFLLDRLALSSGQQRAFRAVVLLAALGFLAVVWVHGDHHPWLTFVGALVAAQAAGMPETNAPLMLLVYLGLLWVVATPDRLDGWTVAAAALLLAVHLACTLVSHGPAGVRLDPAMLRSWAVRAVGCLAAGILVWLSGKVVAGMHRPPSGVLLGAALAVVLTWCGLVAVRIAWSHRG